MSDEQAPTPPSERIVALDALRGVALLGILLINIQVIAMPEVVLFNPTAYGDLSGANYVAWLCTEVFARQKFITIFTLLFGAGVILFTRSIERRGGSPVAFMYRRATWLIIFGLGHAYLLWYGDILVAYGVCGLGVVFLRDLPPMRLVRLGVYLIFVPSAIEVLSALSVDPGTIMTQWEPAQAVLEAEIEAYRSGWFAQLDHRSASAFERQTSGFAVFTAWRTTGTMLLGMALFKWGVLTDERSASFYRRLILVGATLGIGCTLAGVWYIQSTDWAAGSAFYWRQFNYWGSFGLAGAYVGIVMRYTHWRPSGFEVRGLAAVGRTAFSNYILQTVLATSIFYGHGLGLFARLDRVELLGVVLLIWAIQVPLSVVWLRYFRFGPLEWLWRVLTYRSMQPLRV